MKFTVRQENEKDFGAVEDVIARAFAEIDHSDQSEHLLVNRLRKSQTFMAELSLVAEYGNQIVGHILFTPLTIDSEEPYEALALAPVSVLPEFQNQGIGSQLIEKGHEVLRGLGFDVVVLVGHESYYPRFGYVPADSFGIEFPFEIPSKNKMVAIFNHKDSRNYAGMVQYPASFFS